jgi:hypothetical protein
MRNRHFPRLCRACNAPMARQEDTCWRCGTPWVAEPGPRTTLKAAEAPADMDRWIDEGGSIAAVASG